MTARFFSGGDKNPIQLLSLCVVFFILASCDSAKDNQQGLQAGMEGDEFLAYLEYRRISPRNEAHRQELYKEYSEKQVLAAKIAADGLIDMRLLEAEIRSLRNDIMVDRYLKDYSNQANDDAKALEFYEDNASRYQQKSARIAHILFRSHSDLSAEERQSVIDEANRVLTQIKSGEPFAELARKFSEDRGSGAKGGDLGWLKEGALNKRFSEAAFNLAAGNVSELIESDFGIHIIKVLEGPSITQEPFDVVKREIVNELRTSSRNAELARLLKD